MSYTTPQEFQTGKITNQEGWIVVRLEIDQSRMAQLGLTPPVIYRKLSNSKRSFNPLIPNNRDFWSSHIYGGYYISVYSENGFLQMYMFIQSVPDSDMVFVRKNLITRLKSIVLTDIKIGGVELVPEKLLHFISTKSGKDLLQPFGRMFGRKSSTKYSTDAIEMN